MKNNISIILINLLITLTISSFDKPNFQSTFEEIDYKLQNLSNDFISSFTSHYTEQYLTSINSETKSVNQNATQVDMNRKKVGQYLYLLGKMYLYDILPDQQEFIKPNKQGRYILSYIYLKQAAQNYEISRAYYYLSIMDYLKISPALLIKINLQNQLNREFNSTGLKLFDIINKEEIIEELNNNHRHSIEHNLYIASLLGNNQAMGVLAHMYKYGITTEENCLAALPYYLNLIKMNKIDIFEFPTDDKIKDKPGVSFEKQLYRNRKVDLSAYKQNDLDTLLDTVIFTEQTLQAYEDIAINYLYGSNGFPLNQTKAAEMFQKMQSQSKLAKSMLGFIYLKGKGVEKNFTKAKQIFQNSESKMVKQVVLIMKYYGMGYPKSESNRKLALKQMQKISSSHAKLKQLLKYEASGKNATSQQKSKYERIRTALLKYLIGTLILADQIKQNRNIGIQLLEQAASQGSILATIHLGLLFVQGSDDKHDCKRATDYFDENLKNSYFYSYKLQIAKDGIKYDKLMFSLVKYIQLMSVGVKFAFINSYYLLKVYGGQAVYRFTENSWSVKSVKNNTLYNKLLSDKLLSRTVDELLISDYNPQGQKVITKQNLPYLTQFHQMQKPFHYPYSDFAFKKILIAGTDVHSISILFFEKYKKQANNIELLQKIANLPSSMSHVLQARYLLGRHFQNTQSDLSKQNKLKRVLQEYKRATKNSLLANIILIIQGQQIPDIDLLNHLAIYMSFIILVWFLMNKQKKKRLEQIYRNQMRKAEQENIQNQSKQIDTKMKEQNEEQLQFTGLKFSEQKQDQVMNNRLQNKLAAVGFRGIIDENEEQKQQSQGLQDRKIKEQKVDKEFFDYKKIWQNKDIEDSKQKHE